MNTCEMYAEFFSDYVEDTISPEEKQKLDMHLSGCTECQVTIARLKTLRHQLHDLPSFETSPDFDTMLRMRIKLKEHSHYPAIGIANGASMTKLAGYSAVGLVVLFAFAYIIREDQGRIKTAPYSTTLVHTQASHSFAPSNTSNTPSLSGKVFYPLDIISPLQLHLKESRGMYQQTSSFSDSTRANDPPPQLKERNHSLIMYSF